MGLVDNSGSESECKLFEFSLFNLTEALFRNLIHSLLSISIHKYPHSDLSYLYTIARYNAGFNSSFLDLMLGPAWHTNAYFFHRSFCCLLSTRIDAFLSLDECLQPFSKMMALAADFHRIRKFWKLVKIWVPPDCKACYTSLRDTSSI